MHFAGTACTSGGIAPCSLSGSLNATAVAGTATSATRTVTVPVGNSGEIRISDFVDVGTINFAQHNLNGAGFSTFSDPTTFTFTNGQTTALQTTGNGAGESRTYRLTDVTTGKVIATVVHTGG